MQVFQKEGKSIKYKIVVKKNKNTYFRIKDDYVLITTSKYMKHMIPTYLDQQFDKLYKKMQNYQVIDDSMIQLQNKTYEMIFSVGKFSYTKLSDNMIVSGRDISSAKKNIYLSEIKKMMVEVHPKVLNVIKKNNLDALPIKYKFLKSKFGSYHRKHDEITLNTFLATLDPIYLEYVLYHEYAHKLIFNHSKDFYDILDTWMIGHKNIQKALKKMVIR
jgi:predicted metal-dependent hydrolase